MYHSLFASIQNYGAQVWGLLGNWKIKTVERVQKAAVRIITFADFYAHTNQIFQELRILKFQDNIKLQHIFLVHDFKDKKLPVVCFYIFISFLLYSNHNILYTNIWIF